MWKRPDVDGCGTSSSSEFVVTGMDWKRPRHDDLEAGQQQRGAWDWRKPELSNLGASGAASKGVVVYATDWRNLVVDGDGAEISPMGQQVEVLAPGEKVAASYLAPCNWSLSLCIL